MVGKGLRPEERTYAMSGPLFSRLFARATEILDKRFRWHKLPLPLGLLTLMGLRMRLRERNLYDTSSATPAKDSPPEDGRHLTARTVDGAFNDLESPAMGSAETRFGRNVPVELTYPDNDWALLKPSPRTVSRELMTRREFLPATTLNVLAGAWLQFMIRDWFSHGKSETENPWRVELAEDDPWTQERPMRIMRTRKDPTHSPEDSSPPTYLNTETHWWDGSQLYGSNAETQKRVRSGEGGKLLVGPDGMLPRELIVQASKEPGFWVGLAMLQTLFVLEHNAICDRLRAEYPSWSDDDLFDRARLINSALLAKIHTVEWTTAILGHPALQIAMRANWWGVAGERIRKLLGRLGDSEVLSGIPGSPKDHHGVPYAITEEFVAVYRMHPLVPDDFDFRSVSGDERLQQRNFREVAGPRVPEVLDQVLVKDLLYSFGVAHPGAITLHNYPRFLQEYERPDGVLMDLAATDILRSRELGVPRYNEFRKLLRLPPVESFEELTDNPAWAEEMRRVYDNEVNSVDLTVGLYAEPVPEGFGFSDTAFRIFILMASRRLNSDRFFTTDYNARVYTRAGLGWIDDNDMSTVLLRHFPELLPSLRNVKNAFAPWNRTGS
jgi:Animal haem peroxidase